MKCLGVTLKSKLCLSLSLSLSSKNLKVTQSGDMFLFLVKLGALKGSWNILYYMLHFQISYRYEILSARVIYFVYAKMTRWCAVGRQCGKPPGVVLAPKEISGEKSNVLATNFLVMIQPTKILQT